MASCRLAQVGGGGRATATARIQGRAGVETEPLTAVTVALPAAYEMLKSADRAMTLEGIELIEKAGGRSGIVSGSG